MCKNVWWDVQQKTNTTPLIIANSYYLSCTPHTKCHYTGNAPLLNSGLRTICLHKKDVAVAPVALGGGGLDETPARYLATWCPREVAAFKYVVCLPHYTLAFVTDPQIRNPCCWSWMWGRFVTIGL